MNKLNSGTTNSKITKKTKGFTLVEILIVLALIGIVAGLTMTNIGGIFGGSKVKAAQQWVNSTGGSLCYQLFNFSWRISLHFK